MSERAFLEDCQPCFDAAFAVALITFSLLRTVSFHLEFNQ